MGSLKKLLFTLIGIFIFTALVLIYIVPPQKTIESQSPYTITSANKDKKKILIFSSRGGGGHLSVTQALEQYLQEDFCIGHSFIFVDVLSRMDPVKKILNGKTSGEDWYNLIARKKWYQLANVTYAFGSWYYNFCRKSVEPLIEQYLIMHKPDLIISVIPVINNLILNVAKKLNIPFMLIPTDLDATIALNGIHNPHFDNFYLVLSYEHPMILESVKKAGIDNKYISYTGFPIKKEFFEPHNCRAIKKEFNIPEDKPVILLIMGAQGSKDLYEFSKQLAKLPIPAHVIIVLGKSEHLRKSFNRIIFPKHITTTLLGFTDRIPDLMHIADLLITKSGSVSVNEAIYAQLPMLLDSTSAVLQWEQFNHKFIVKNQFGSIIKRTYRIPTTVTRMLTDKTSYDMFKNNLATFDKKNPEQEIKMLVKRILTTPL